MRSGAGAVLAMAQQYRTRLDLADKVEQIVPVGVSGEIELLKFTAPGNFARAGA